MNHRTASRRIEGQAAVATWSLRRVRQVAPARGAEATRLLEPLTNARVSAARREFHYRGRRWPLRPAVAALLAHLWQAGVTPVPVPDLCAAVYGRPVSLRAIRQSVFRANRVMERADCPVAFRCHQATVFVRQRVRNFEPQTA